MIILRHLKQLILTTLFAVFASQASAMFIQPDWYDPTDPRVGTNRYSYSFNDPVNLRDPGGNYVESGWDAFNIGIGLGSAGYNFYNGNIGAGLLDLGGVVVDGVATALPIVPGGAGTAIQGWRGSKVAQAARRSPCNSFAGHTLIETDVGLLPISEVVPGDLVWSKNDETGEVGFNPVIDIFNNLHSSHLALIVEVSGNAETIQITKEHPVFVENRGWVPAGELQVGDVIETRNGDGARVTSVDIIQEAITAYNFEVANYHTYYATRSGLLVHNGLFGIDWGGLFGGGGRTDSPADANRGGGDNGGSERGNPQNTTQRVDDPHAQAIRQEGQRIAGQGGTAHYNRSTDAVLKEHGLKPIGGAEGRMRPDVLGVEIRSDGTGKIEVIEVTSPSQKNRQPAGKAEQIADKIRSSNPRATVKSRAFPCG